MFVLGLHEDGDRIFDDQGRNTLKIAGADPGSSAPRMHGNDLVLTQADQVLATIDDYAHHAANFAGLDLGQGMRPIADFVTQPSAALSAQALDAGDLLAEYVPAASGLREAAPLPEPWSMLDASATTATPAAGAGDQPRSAAPTPGHGADDDRGRPRRPAASGRRSLAAGRRACRRRRAAQAGEDAVIDPAQERHAYRLSAAQPFLPV